MNLLLKPWVALALAAGTSASLAAAELPGATKSFLTQHCTDCHDADTRKGELDLASLAFEPANPKNFATWVKVHDRVREGEMPPKKKARPDTKATENFLAALEKPLQLADRKRETSEGRSTWRRLNRYEYENTLRDLLGAPWLQVKEMLPEDGEAFRFNKVGDALDVSHVQMARYLSAAEYALREVLAKQLNRPEAKVTRYYTREQRTFTGKMKYSVFNTAPERATFPVLGTKGQPEVRAGKAPMSVGEADPKMREEEGVGVVASSYEPIELRFNGFVAAQAGHYKLRFSAHSVWVGPGTGNKWYIPDLDNVSAGRRSEPITIYSETPPRLLRRLGAFDVAAEPTVKELDVHLLKGETIRPDAARFFRSRPGSTRWHNPLAEPDGQPGVSFRWMEVEGPIIDEWPMAGHKLMFGSLPLKEAEGGKVTVVPADPAKDSERLLTAFMKATYRRPVEKPEVQRFLAVIKGAMKSGSDFTDAMIAGYSAVLCSPEFVCLEEKPGNLDDYALASRLSYFIWNTAPDARLRAVAAKGQLRKADTLRAETERLLGDPRSHRFVNAFLDYWLDLRRVEATSPDSALYNDYYLDDLLVESATEETRAFFSELIKGDLPSRNIVASDFAMVNERLANHYGLSPVEGVALRRTRLPADSPRGGLMTQASVLKVTANGTTTSPVVRGAWIMERILGKPPPKPPPSVPAVEPDIRGATTIRQQLAQHRDQESCAACHAKIDPAGFALENFDVAGGWRDQYRALGEGERVKGWGKGGQPHEFHLAQKVDGSGELPDGRKFGDVRELKNLLSKDERQIARNLAQQLVVYATGAPVRFGDRREVEEILDHASASHWGVRSLIHEVVQSDLFRVK